MLLLEVVTVSRAVSSTTRRLAKVELIAAALRDAGADEVAVVVPWLSGELRQRRTGIGWASLRDLPAPAAGSTLTVAAVDRLLERAASAAGAGSAGERQRIVAELFGAATVEEQGFLRALVSGELRQGALEGVMVDAVARAAGVPLPAVRRAVMLRGAVAPVAAAALTGGEAALAEFRLQVGRPVQPMLASTAASVPAALEALGGVPVAVDWKLDGIRVQVHRDGDDVAVFTRSLDDITRRVPELVEAARRLPVTTAVLDGEAIALRDDGRPRPFQETGSRTATRSTGSPVPLSWFIFDALHLDGEDILDLPLAERYERLMSVVPEELLVPRVITASVDAASGVLADTLARGHEGVVVKSLEAAYDAGRRGAGWLKVKPVHTLDLVVLAAEWGSGRRRGWLSNLHLGARDPETGGFVMLGKTFKGMTDELLRWQTEQLQQIEVSRNDWQVFVEPRLVVEVAIDGVQASTRYPGGVALRFARIVRYRDDKSAAEADTLETVRSYLP
ncbi:MAG TPA: ATP-dependent DNA ligase [Mycobacteriales bacterium]|nr:ATP-dependent DNA ligase [Mycobacteriales bacterium]